MKKIYTILTSVLFALTSCDMDVAPQGVIPSDESLQSVDDYESFYTGMHSIMREVTSGDYIVLSDIQLDDFHAVIGNGNRRMEFYNGTVIPTTSEVSAFYSAYYNVIAHSNIVLDNADNIANNPNLSAKDAARMKKYVAAALFFRAYSYNCLADKFCESYKNAADLDAADKGLSLQTSYSPTGDSGKYPARSSLRKTYSQIISDLTSALNKMEDAEKVLGEKGMQNSYYITSDAIKALLARVYLNMGNDKEALSYAKGIIASNTYPLIKDVAAYKTLWTTDEGTEVIWRVFADKNHLGFATGVSFVTNNSNNSDYVPTNDCIYLFDENDVRWSAWFEESLVENSGKAMMYRFIKYPGNPNLYASGAKSNFVNIMKPFRSPELYLIAAEASFNLSDESSANTYLNTLKIARIKNFRAKDLTGSALIGEIQNERRRELVGEGFRLADLKRWKLGFTRGDVFDGNDNVIVTAAKNLHYEADDYRLVWPVPQHEIDANPQVKQNKGY